MAKRTDVLNYLENMGGNILCLQETHWVELDIGNLKNIWKGDRFNMVLKPTQEGLLF